MREKSKTLSKAEVARIMLLSQRAVEDLKPEKGGIFDLNKRRAGISQAEIRAFLKRNPNPKIPEQTLEQKFD